MTAKFSQFIYGFYPEAERWRVNLTFLLAVVLLIPMLIPRLPGKGINATPVLRRVSGRRLLPAAWRRPEGIWRQLDRQHPVRLQRQHRGGRPTSCVSLSASSAIGPLLWLIGKLLVLISTVISWILWPLTWLRDLIQSSGRPVWADLVATAVIVSGLMFWLGGGMRAGVRPLITSLVIFACIGIVIAIMGLDRGGLPVVDTRLWGGLLVTLVVSVTGIVTSMPVGIALALGRRSTIPLIRVFSVAFIEFWRGVPLITVLFFATYMLPLFLPGNFTVDGLVRALIGIALFAGAYQAEVIRGGLAAIPRGQGEAASALGLSFWKTTGLIVMPQALRHVIPGLVNSFIALVQGHLAGLDRRAVRSARAVAGRLQPIPTGRRQRRCSPASPSPD